MTFAEAKKRLKLLAGGRFHKLIFGLTEFHNGDHEVECITYVDGYGHHTASTWEGSFVLISDALNKDESKSDYDETQGPDYEEPDHA